MSELDIGQAYIHQRLQLTRQGRDCIKEYSRLFDGHLQHFVDALALVFDLKGFTVVALALAHIARHVDVREKVHFYLDQAITLTGFTASALHVEGETPRAITAGAGLRHAREQFTDRGKQPGVSRRVGARRSANRALVDVDDLVQVLQPLDAVVRGCFQRGGAIECGGAERVERVVDEGRFTRAGNPGYTGQQADRNFQIHIAQVVAAGALERQRQLLVAWRALGRHGDFHPARQVFAGQRVRVCHDFGRCAFSDDMAAMHARARADINHIVGQANGVLVVLHHDHRVADIAQVLEGAQQTVVITLVQADGGLVEDIQHPNQPRTNLAGQTNTLGFTA